MTMAVQSISLFCKYTHSHRPKKKTEQTVKHVIHPWVLLQSMDLPHSSLAVSAWRQKKNVHLMKKAKSKYKIRYVFFLFRTYIRGPSYLLSVFFFFFFVQWNEIRALPFDILFRGLSFRDYMIFELDGKNRIQQYNIVEHNFFFLYCASFAP